MFAFMIFIGLLTSTSNASNHTKCVSLGNQKYKIQPMLINLHHNEYTQGLRYNTTAVNRDRCVGSFNTFNDLSNKVCVQKKEDLDLSGFNMITGINEIKLLTKHISCIYKFKFTGRKYNSNQKWNNNKCRWECKNSKKHHA